MALVVKNFSPTGTVETTGATPTVALAWTPPEDSTVVIKANVLARSPNGAVRGVYNLFGMAKRAGSGNVSVIGTPQVLSGLDALAVSWLAALGASGSELRLIVTGLALTDIQWGAQFDACCFYDEVIDP